MNGSTLARLAISLAFVLWAVFALTPVNDTPFDEYLVERVTARLDAEGTQVLSEEENEAAFRDLLARAEARVAASVADEDETNSTLYLELLGLTRDENIDLADYYADLRIRDVANLTKRNSLVLNRLLRDSKGELQPGLDLAGGVSVTLEIPEDTLQESGFLREQELEQAREVIVDRIDAFGVAEPTVRIRGNNQIEVQIAGASTEQNTEIIKDLIRPAKLEFSLVHRTARPSPDSTPPLGYVVRYEERDDPESGRMLEIPHYVKRIPVMTGEAIDRARARITQTGGFEIQMDFTGEGGDTFAEVTRQIARENSGRSIGQLAIILDDKVVSAPTVREAITGGSAVITGQFSQREALALATALNNPLAIELEIAAMNNVSGTLAEEAKSASILAATIGAGLVVLFMVGWYGLAGVAAVLTVTINVLLVMGGLAAFGATISLPGVAALVLTVGMAVDANILIFERIREELQAGKNMRHAVTDGYGKALSTILDANVTTLITALILIYFGTGPVKGFGVTLSLGIGSTIITSLITSRLLMDTLVQTHLMKALPKRVKLVKRETPFLNFAGRAFLTSWVVVLLGILGLALHWDRAFGIDFTGGDEIQLSYEQDLTDSQIEEAVLAAGVSNVNVLRMSPLGADTEMLTVQVGADEGQRTVDALEAAYPEAGLESIGVVQVGPSVGAEVSSSAFQSMAIALIGMLFYIALRFEFGFGLGALVATMHDVLLTVGMFFVLGEFLNIGSGQFTAPMIAAVLMTVGYSINDTIVVFDRVREELQLNPGSSLKKIVHLSINRVLTRTILTSVTTIFAAFALYLFGAGVIVDFALVFLLGVITGTFSSIFIASPIFYRYHKGDRKSVEKGEFLPSYDWSSEGEKREPSKA
ncbi:MAG: protein translocase subunit SecD [Opitutales bacterium]